jgi:hypothetical protein
MSTLGRLKMLRYCWMKISPNIRRSIQAERSTALVALWQTKRFLFNADGPMSVFGRFEAGPELRNWAFSFSSMLEFQAESVMFFQDCLVALEVC